MLLVTFGIIWILLSLTGPSYVGEEISVLKSLRALLFGDLDYSGKWKVVGNALTVSGVFCSIPYNPR